MMSKCRPKKWFLAIAIAGGLVGLAVVAKRRGEGESGTPGPTMWEKMEEAMAAMPETFPARVMFDNIAAIREDTTRIIELLGNSEPADEGSGRGSSEKSGNDAPTG